MPITSVVDPTRRLVVTQVRGAVAMADVLANREQLAADPAFDPSYDHLFDLSGAEHVDVAPGDIRDFAAVALFDETSRRAVVAPANVVFGFSRMYQAYRDLADEQMQIFRTREEALEWLRQREEDDNANP